MITALTRTGMAALALWLGLGAAHAQTNLRGWYADGQIWLVWIDTDPTTSSYRIYRSLAQISELDQASLIGRLFQNDLQASRLRLSGSEVTWIIPDGGGGTYTLEADEALFVSTARDQSAWHFAVVKDAEEAVGPDNRVGPILQDVEPVRCHLQDEGASYGRPYRTYAHWIDGHVDWTSNRSDYPVMGNQHFNGTAAVFRVWEPLGGKQPGPVPAVVGLHGGGGSYVGARPVRNDGSETLFSLEDGLLIALDDPVIVQRSNDVGPSRTYWFGYWEGYDPFVSPDDQPVPDDGLIVDYTMRRLEWTLDWLLANEQIDPDRVSVAGGSMGGRGVIYHTRRYPERYAAGIAFVPGIEPHDTDPLFGNRDQQLLTNLPEFRPIAEVSNPAIAISETERDMVLTKMVSGRNDTTGGAGWSSKRVQQYQDLNDAGYGHHLYWDERSHVNWLGAHWTGSPKIDIENLTAYRRDQSFPAFFNDDHDPAVAERQPDIGNGEPNDGTPWGTWAGYYEWDMATIEDTPTMWAVTVNLTNSSTFENDIPTFDTATADVAIRRPQRFKPARGTSFSWTLAPLDGRSGAQSGSGVVGDDGLVVVEDLILSAAPSRLSVTSPHAILAVINAAGYQPLISPGSIVSLFGSFSPTSPRSAVIPLDVNLEGLSITFNGEQGAMFAVFGDDFGLGYHQINVLAPWQFDVSSGTVEVQVHRQEGNVTVSSEPFVVAGALASPAIFQYPNGSGQAIVTNFKVSEDDDVIADSFAQTASSVAPVVGQPAARGGIAIIWCTGLGPVLPLPPTGGIPPAGVVPTTELTIRVYIGGIEVTIIGTPVLQPTNVGLNQINIVVPGDAPVGDNVPIVIEIDFGDGQVIRSEGDVTIAMR